MVIVCLSPSSFCVSPPLIGGLFATLALIGYTGIMYPRARTTLRMVLGIFLIIFGIAGMILPILPGWWVALIGLEILGWKLVIDHHKPWLEMISLRRKNKEVE